MTPRQYLNVIYLTKSTFKSDKILEASCDDVLIGTINNDLIENHGNIKSYFDSRHIG